MGCTVHTFRRRKRSRRLFVAAGQVLAVAAAEVAYRQQGEGNSIPTGAIKMQLKRFENGIFTNGNI